MVGIGLKKIYFFIPYWLKVATKKCKILPSYDKVVLRMLETPR